MKKISSIVKLGLVSAVVVGFSGCSTKTPIVNTPLKLNYTLQKGKNIQKTDKTIIILDSKSKRAEIEAKMTKNASSMNPLSRMIAQKMAQGMGQVSGCDFNSIYYKNYEKQFLTSLKSKLSDIFEANGFTTITEYKEYNDIPYKIRKNSYLLVYPNVDLVFSKNKSDHSQTGSKYTEKGQMNLNSVVKLDYLEPLSKEKIDTLKVNLTDTGIENNYICQQDFERESGKSAFDMGFNIGTKMGEVLFANKEPDTTRIVTSDSLNKIFYMIMNELDKKIHKEDILTYSNDIQEIKNKKRY